MYHIISYYIILLDLYSILLTAHGQFQSCANQWYLYEDTLYRLEYTLRNFADARAFCQTYGGDMAVLSTVPIRVCNNNYNSIYVCILYKDCGTSNTSNDLYVAIDLLVPYVWICRAGACDPLFWIGGQDYKGKCQNFRQIRNI